MVRKTLFGQFVFARSALSGGDCKSMSPFSISTGTLGNGPWQGGRRLGENPGLGPRGRSRPAPMRSRPSPALRTTRTRRRGSSASRRAGLAFFAPNGSGHDGPGGGDRPDPDQGGPGHQLGRYRQAVASDRTGAEPEDVIAGVKRHGVGVTGHDVLAQLPGRPPGSPARVTKASAPGRSGRSKTGAGPRPTVKDRIAGFLRPPGRSARGWTSTLFRQPPRAEPGKPGALAPDAHRVAACGQSR
jgi:hypothetical protein